LLAQIEWIEDEVIYLPIPERVEPEPRRKRKIIDQHPEIVHTVKDFVESHGFSAQERRRTDVGNSTGVTLQQVVHHVQHTLGLKVGLR
jgi:hypothetical protein